MFLLLILFMIAFLLIAFLVGAISIAGTVGIVVFGDVIVCLGAIIFIIVKLIKKRH